MRAKCHTFFRNFPQLAKTENLKTTRVGQDRPWPRHEPVQPTELADLINPRTKIKVIGVPQQNFDAQLLQHILRHAFHRSLRSDGHEYWSFDRSMRRKQPASPGGASGCVHLECKGHWLRL